MLGEGFVGIREDECAHDDVGVTIDVFRERMKDDISSKEKGGGVEW